MKVLDEEKYNEFMSDIRNIVATSIAVKFATEVATLVEEADYSFEDALLQMDLEYKISGTMYRTAIYFLSTHWVEQEILNDYLTNN